MTSEGHVKSEGHHDCINKHKKMKEEIYNGFPRKTAKRNEKFEMTRNRQIKATIIAYLVPFNLESRGYFVD